MAPTERSVQSTKSVIVLVIGLLLIPVISLWYEIGSGCTGLFWGSAFFSIIFLLSFALFILSFWVSTILLISKRLRNVHWWIWTTLYFFDVAVTVVVLRNIVPLLFC